MTNEDAQKFIALFPGAKENEPMSAHTNFRIGGLARLFFAAATTDELVGAVTSAKEVGIPYFIIGGGSNLLASDDGFDGVVIQAAHRSIEIGGTDVYADSGAITSLVARQSVEKGLRGFEWAIGVPGTIGGAIFGNAGCYGGETGASVDFVDALRLSDLARVKISQADCYFAYRDSIFKHEPHLILGCQLRLEASPDASVERKRMEEIMATRREKQPLDQPSAGCIFKNFTYQDEAALEILKRQVDEIPAAMLANKSLGAGWLIDRVGMTGTTVGDAQVSTKHGNFFLNRGTARAQDMLALISMVKMKVRDELGIELQEEVQLVGF